MKVEVVMTWPASVSRWREAFLPFPQQWEKVARRAYTSARLLSRNMVESSGVLMVGVVLPPQGPSWLGHSELEDRAAGVSRCVRQGRRTKTLMY